MTVAPRAAAAALAPSYEYWLKFLSVIDPTSVTTPILRLELGATVPVAPEPEVGEDVAPEPEHAATMAAMEISEQALRSILLIRLSPLS